MVSEEEFRRLEDRVRELEALEFTHLRLAQQHREPVRPREGMLVYADGTNWDPGESLGLYQFQNSNWVLLGGAGIGKHTIWVPATAMYPRTTVGAAYGTAETTTNKVMLKTLDFDAAATEFAQFCIRMPKSWNLGTVTAAFVWSHPATTTDFGVSWGIQATALSNDDALDTAFGTAVQTVDTGGTTNDVYMSAESTAVTIGGTPAAEDYVVFQIFRKHDEAGDTMAVDARLHGVSLYYTTDKPTDA